MTQKFAIFRPKRKSIEPKWTKKGQKRGQNGHTFIENYWP